MPSLTPYDEYFVHQLPEPLSVVAIEHQHWRESYFIVAHGPEVDSDVIAIAMATYPARHMVDALVLGRIGGTLLGGYHQRPADGDPHTTVVGPVSVVIEEPFRRVHVVVDEADGLHADLTFEARTGPYALRRGRLLDDQGALLWDQSHMIQSGTFSGSYEKGGDGGSVDRLARPARPLVGGARPRPDPLLDLVRHPAARRDARGLALGAGQRGPHLHRRLLGPGRWECPRSRHRLPPRSAVDRRRRRRRRLRRATGRRWSVCRARWSSPSRTDER